MPYTKKSYQKPTICWKCKNAVPSERYGCTWSISCGEVPVEGWDAEPTVIRNAGHRKGSGTYELTSYRVKACPKFVRDDQPKQKETWDGVQEVIPAAYSRLHRIRAGAQRVARRNRNPLKTK